MRVRCFLVVVVLVLCLVSGVAAYEGTWWNESWGKMRPITITDPPSVSDFQVIANVTYDSDMQSDFDDLRFVDDDEVTELDYWIEGQTDGSFANVWIELSDTGNTVYMYYNNSAASAGSNGSNTFLQWHGVATSAYLDSLVVPATNVVFESRFKVTSATHNFVIGLSNTAVNNDDSEDIQSDSSVNLRKCFTENENVATTISETPSFTQGVFYRLKIINDNSNVHGYVDGNEIGTGISTNIPDETLGLRMRVVSGTFEQPWSFARKYTLNEPSTAIGAEVGANAPPTAQFTATPLIGAPPLSVQFNDTSTATPTSWFWTFGDGYTSILQDPPHTYTSTGLYTVSLKATNEYGNDTETKTDYIDVGDPPTAAFTAVPTFGYAPLNVTFTDTSLNNPTEWAWDFDDGNTSILQNPPYNTFTNSGIYTVTLTATNAYGYNSTSTNITVDTIYPFPGISKLPTDIDADGIYEDINGNERLDYNDLIIFFQNLAWAKINEPINAFDLNNNGQIDYNDVILLFNKITGAT